MTFLLEGDACACPLCEVVGHSDPHLSYRNMIWMRCGVCGFMFQNPYISEHRRENRFEIETVYGSFDETTLPATVTAEKRDWILRACSMDEQVLCIEIGPGPGDLLQQLRERRPRWQYLAIEAYPLFQRALKSKDFDCIESIDALDNLSVSSIEKVIVVADNVLEHMEHPVGVLERLLEFARAFRIPLKVLIEVPNERGIRWRYRLQDWLRGSRKSPTFPGHINLFERSTLKRAAILAGYQGITVYDIGIRSVDQVAYLMRKPVHSSRIRFTVRTLRSTRIDTMLGFGYWLRAELSSS